MKGPSKYKLVFIKINFGKLYHSLHSLANGKLFEGLKGAETYMAGMGCMTIVGIQLETIPIVCMPKFIKSKPWCHQDGKLYASIRPNMIKTYRLRM